ncbi:MAG: amidohydrolase [Paludibacteraceae bacterium]|nr:amidohydrolase [Paludibacteraceae bacterium]
MKKRILYLMTLLLTLSMLLVSCGWHQNQDARQVAKAILAESGEADIIVYGQICTMDTLCPTAEAMTVKNGLIQYVGSAQVAKKLRGKHTQIADYGTNYVYPGICESHAHGALAASRLYLEADLVDKAKKMTDYAQLMKEYMENHPGMTLYRGSGWDVLDTLPDARMLDAVCPDVPMVLQSSDGHSMWLNTAALNAYGFTPEYAKEAGYDLVRVREDGTPTGYISETPVSKLVKYIAPSKDDYKKGLLMWQDYAFTQGITATTEAFLNIGGDAVIDAYRELVDEGLWHLRTFAVYCVDENAEDPQAELDKIVKLSREADSEYFKISGLKVFMDGVVEAHTGWLLQPYADDSTYYGLKRRTDVEQLSQMIQYINENGLSVHFHTIGDGAVHTAIEAVALAEDRIGKRDCRNIFSHLQVVDSADIVKMGEYQVIAAVAPLWMPTVQPFYDRDVSYIGTDRAWNDYPVRSFLNAGCVITFHTDYPVSSEMSIPRSIYCAVRRSMHAPGAEMAKNPKECINPQQAMKAMTVNVAYQWRQEDHLGSLTPGKAANYVVYDTDLVNDDMECVYNARLLCTAVDGIEYYNVNRIEEGDLE